MASHICNELTASKTETEKGGGGRGYIGKEIQNEERSDQAGSETKTERRTRRGRRRQRDQRAGDRRGAADK